MTATLNILLLLFLVVSAIIAVRCRDLLSSVIVFAAYSLVMAVLWQLQGAPYPAVALAIFGAGATPLLLLAAIRKTGGQE
ncbi:MAG: DUF4040 domain-containing protein [Eubacteriales bacterium]|jgi:uncharacterized MnhB-related membrane protein|nr:DUF4040 domain-containing protein [Eubacteriales bacterium]